MHPTDFKPWWERVNEYLSFDEHKEFVRGATAYRPNQEMEVIMGMLQAGYVRKAPEIPQPYTGKKKQ